MVQMSERTLQLLESERFLELSEPAFARGYLRRYAPCLKLNTQEVMALFDSWMLIQQAQDHRLNSHMVSSAAARNVRPGYFTVGAIFILKKVSTHISRANQAFDQFIHNKVGHAVAITFFIGIFSFFLSNNAKTTSSEILITNADTAVVTAHIETKKTLISREISVAVDEVALQKIPATVVDPSYLVATATTHVTVFDRNHLILFRGIVKAGHPVAISGLKPFDMQSARVGTIMLVDAASLPIKFRRIAAL